MDIGKLSAQAGHSFTDALCNAQQSHPEAYDAYRTKGLGGSKVSLYAKSTHQLLRAYNEALEAGLPCAIVVDQNHVMPPHFDGSPVVTAVGIGPCKKQDARFITKRFNCVK